MFSKHSKHDPLPDEMIFEILQWLPLKDAAKAFSETSKAMHEVVNRNLIKNVGFWKKQGAVNFEDFCKRLGDLPPYLQGLVLNDKYRLKFCEDFFSEYRKCESNPMRLIREMLPEYADSLKGLDNEMFSDIQKLNLCIAFLERLISPSQMILLGDNKTQQLIQTNKGIKALRNKLITFEEVLQAKNGRGALDLLIERRVTQFEVDKNDAPPFKKHKPS